MAMRSEAEKFCKKIKLVSGAIKANLSEDLRHKKYRTKHPLSGLCYVAAEAGYHLLGGKKAGWRPFFVKVSGVPHWFIEYIPSAPYWLRSMRLDPCGSQFKDDENWMPHYPDAVGKGFLTNKPSKRAQILIKRVKQYIKEQNGDL